MLVISRSYWRRPSDSLPDAGHAWQDLLTTIVSHTLNLNTSDRPSSRCENAIHNPGAITTTRSTRFYINPALRLFLLTGSRGLLGPRKLWGIHIKHEHHLNNGYAAGHYQRLEKISALTSLYGSPQKTTALTLLPRYLAGVQESPCAKQAK